MKGKILLFFFVFKISVLFSQVAPNQYVIFFNTKQGTSYSIENPQAFLSARALERRISHNIPIDETDLPVNPVFIDSLESVGAEILHAGKWFNFVIINGDNTIVNSINEFSFVDSDRTIIDAKIKSIPVGNKFEMVLSKQISETPTSAQVQSQIGLNTLHSLGFKGAGVRVAVIDAGFSSLDEMSAFSHLFEENRVVATRNVADEYDIYFGHSHGTMVSSIMCGVFPDQQFEGGAIDAEYVFIRSETGATEYIVEEYNWVVAAEFADSIGVDVINSSLGYTKFDWPQHNHSVDDLDGQTSIITRGAGMAFRKGMIVVNSAGNDGNAPWAYLGVPADHTDVLAIGSVDISGNYSTFSSLGLPSHEYKPDIAACGENAPYVYGESVSNGNGTSFSSPLVAAAITCLWQAFPEKSNQEIIAAVRASGSLYPAGNQNIGYGIPDFYKAFITLSDSQYIPSDPFKFEFINAFVNENSDLQIKIYSPDERNVDIYIYDLQNRLCFKSNYSISNAVVSDIIISQSNLPMHGQLVLVRIEGKSAVRARKVFLR